MKVGGKTHAVQRGLRIRGGQPTLLDPSGQVPLVGISSLAQLSLVCVLERDVDAVQRGLLRDLRAHAACADDGESRRHCIQ